MKKKILAWGLAVLMMVTLVPSVLAPVIASAAAVPQNAEAPIKIEAALDDDLEDYYIDFTDEIIVKMGVTSALKTELDKKKNHRDYLDMTLTVQIDWSVNADNDWKCSGRNVWRSFNEYGKNMADNPDYANGIVLSMFRSNYNAPKDGGYESICRGIDANGYGWLELEDNIIYMRARFWLHSGKEEVFSDWSDVFSVGNVTKTVHAVENPFISDWAREEVGRAEELELIPDCLFEQDLTKPITRAEFAAVCVKVYESLTWTLVEPVANNPFNDCDDIDVLKAYNLGVVNGTSATAFSPNYTLNREQAATMLTRVYKAIAYPGWTLAKDNQFVLEYDKPALFADDANISAFAKDSVYFMVANGVIMGVGNNRFLPRNITEAEIAEGTASATRQQAIIIAVRMVENLG